MRLRYSGKNVLLLTSEFGSSTQRERKFLKVFRNRTVLRTTPKLGTSRGPSQFLNIIVRPNFSPSWSDHNFNCLPLRQITQLSAYMVQIQLSTDVFFKIPQFLSPSLPGMTPFSLQPHFLLGVYYENCDCQILCARA